MTHGMIRIQPGSAFAPHQQLLAQGIEDRVIARIMKKDASVFARDAAVRRLVADRLGWIGVASVMKRQIPAIERFGTDVIKSGVRHVVLVGMGGSSLCPELFKLMFGKHKKLASFDVLDSTDPAAILNLQKRLNLKKTLFIIASKSGGTVETRSHEAYFMEKLKRLGVPFPGRCFVAITDKGSLLESFAREQKYRKVFLNPPDIGGRYSALSYFGLVPGFFAGVNLRSLVDSAVAMEALIRERCDESNPALSLASLITAAAQSGRDKLTFLASATWAPLVPWIEQLVAESTGKQGKGIVPIDAEPIGQAKCYGTDRAYVSIRSSSETSRAIGALKKQLTADGAPCVEIITDFPHDLGAQFVIWEMATAVVGYHMGINPFDEPNVTESKENTKKILAGFKLIGPRAAKGKLTFADRLTLLALDETTPHDYSGEHDMKAVLKQFLSDLRSPHYISTLCYFAANRGTERELALLRRSMRDRLGVATLRGYGPRFLHSVGQLYKGGPQTGHFIVFVRGNYGKLHIPGEPFDFGQLICAQALGDTQALAGRRLPALMISINGPVAAGLKAFRELVTSLLQQEGN